MSAPADRLAAALSRSYRLERELGQGGMATVYLAEDLKHKRMVAIKVLKPELAAVLGAERFVQEITTTAALQHPHILPLFDSGSVYGPDKSGPYMFYVMPFIDGETLRSKLDRDTQLGIDEAVKIATAVADALDYAHRQGVIHRDIKPENILLHEGRPMVADFGIALAVSAAAGGRMTETGLSLGTPHYMSPEQATAEKEISARSDVYSLGSVLYEMLTGAPPHVGGSAQQIIMKIVTEDAAPVTRMRKSVPMNVAAAVAQALEKLPADRFESARAFAEALTNPSFATTAFLATSSGAGISRRGSNRLAVALGGIALAALALALWGWFRPVPPGEVLRYSLALPEDQMLAATDQSRIAISPDGRVLVYAVDLPTGRQLVVRRRDELDATPLRGTEGAINPAFSPDGLMLAFVTEGVPRALRVIPLAGGPPVTVTDSLVELGGVSWGPDGYIYYDGQLEGDGLARVPETGGTPEPASVTDQGQLWHFQPEALPGGRGVLFTAAQGSLGNMSIAVLDLKTRQHRVLFPGQTPKYLSSGHLAYVTTDGTLMAVPFDEDRLEVTGAAVPLAERLAIRGLARADLSVSRTGTLTYTTGSDDDRQEEFLWVGRDGTVTSVDPGWRPSVSGFALSPDGRQVAVVVDVPDRQLWVKPLDGGPAARISVERGGIGRGVAWSANGEDILFLVPTPDGTDVMRVPADGSRLPALVQSTPRRIHWVQMSPDGGWLTLGEAAGDILGMRSTDDSLPTVLVGAGEAGYGGVVSPDGRWIAYLSPVAMGEGQVVVRPFPETQVAKKVVANTPVLAYPAWSADGRELFFLDRDRNLVAVDVQPGEAFTVGRERVLFNAARYFDGQVLGLPIAPSPDGRRFLLLRPNSDAASRLDLIVVENFLEEVRAKVKR